MGHLQVEQVPEPVFLVGLVSQQSQDVLVSHRFLAVRNSLSIKPCCVSLCIVLDPIKAVPGIIVQSFLHAPLREDSITSRVRRQACPATSDALFSELRSVQQDTAGEAP